MRACNSAKVSSVSGKAGASLPDKRAAAPFALSQATCTCFFSGNMSGAKRSLRSALSCKPFSLANASALVRIVSRADRLFTIPGKVN